MEAPTMMIMDRLLLWCSSTCF